jgi:hypothetical protein
MKQRSPMSRTSKILPAFSAVLLGFLSPLSAQTRDAAKSPPDQPPPPLKGLQASGPLQGLGDKLRLFGQFVDDWECEEWAVNADGSKQIPNQCEWHWSWILDGRAVQDVWIVHPNGGKPDAPPVEHGTTIRVYDPKIDAWHCFWIGPVKNNFVALTAKQIGKEIVLETGNDQGRVGQWIFSDITRDAFHWRGQGSSDGGKTWHVLQEMNVRRKK